MTYQSDDKDLDKLLAQPSQVADRGFTENLRIELEKTESKHSWVLAAVAACCIAALALAGTQMALFNYLPRLDELWGDLLASASHALPLQVINDVAGIENPTLMGTVFVVSLIFLLAHQLADEELH